MECPGIQSLHASAGIGDKTQGPGQGSLRNAKTY